jgi:chemotaxis protein histidine kinase CheA
MDIKEQILVALGLNKDEGVKLAWQGKSEDGTIFVSTAEELEAGVDISVLTEDGTTILLPIGTYKTDTGVTIRVEEEGVVGEIIESESEEEIEAEDEEKEEMKSEADEAYEKAEFEDKDDKEEYEEESEAEETDWAKTYEEMKDRVENLEDAIADIKSRLGESKTEDVEMENAEPSKNPRTKTTKTTEVVEFSVEELKAENEKLKAKLAESPAEAPINTNKFSSARKPLSTIEYNKLSKRERFIYNLNK